MRLVHDVAQTHSKLGRTLCQQLVAKGVLNKPADQQLWTQAFLDELPSSVRHCSPAVGEHTGRCRGHDPRASSYPRWDTARCREPARGGRPAAGHPRKRDAASGWRRGSRRADRACSSWLSRMGFGCRMVVCDTNALLGARSGGDRAWTWARGTLRRTCRRGSRHHGPCHVRGVVIAGRRSPAGRQHPAVGPCAPLPRRPRPRQRLFSARTRAR